MIPISALSSVTIHSLLIKYLQAGTFMSICPLAHFMIFACKCQRPYRSAAGKAVADAHFMVRDAKEQQPNLRKRCPNDDSEASVGRAALAAATERLFEPTAAGALFQ